MSRLMPYAIRQKGDGWHFLVDYQLVKFAAPRSAGEALFNTEIEKAAAALPLGPRNAGAVDSFPHEFHGWAAVIYASPRLLSGSVSTFEINWLASQINFESTSIHVDLERGVLLTVDDLFDRPALMTLRSACFRQVVTQRSKKLKEVTTANHVRPEIVKTMEEAMTRRHGDMARIIVKRLRDIGSWHFGEEKATLEIGAVGGYRWDGVHSCNFAMADLRKLARPGAPLPE